MHTLKFIIERHFSEIEILDFGHKGWEGEIERGSTHFQPAQIISLLPITAAFNLD